MNQINTDSHATQDNVLTITRLFNAPRDLVFSVWTDLNHLLSWWGPIQFPVNEMTMDIRPGGQWRACLKAVDDGRELWQQGVFREVVKPEKLVFTFAWQAGGERDMETLITIHFEDLDTQTLMIFHQTPFQSVAKRDGHQHGWSGTFDRLDAFLANHTNS
ncbi:SRPBCC domain-containing protein [Ampullimonas aquatilis]|uniref:SRPBCC domain-containing protein n=1 Tax=Ampullimonas aquatilis TaxID=1341549 RepID=UPI003C796424